MFGIGIPQLLVILVIIFIIFGAGKLPEIGSGIGKAIRSFKRELDGIKETGEDFKKSLPGVQQVSELKDTIDTIKDTIKPGSQK